MTEIDVLRLAASLAGMTFFLITSWLTPTRARPRRLRGFVEFGVGVSLIFLLVSMARTVDSGNTRLWPPLHREVWAVAIGGCAAAGGTLGICGIGDFIGVGLGRVRVRLIAVGTVFVLAWMSIALWLEASRGIHPQRTILIGMGTVIAALGLARPKWLPWDPDNPLGVNQAGGFVLLVAVGALFILLGLLAPREFLWR